MNPTEWLEQHEHQLPQMKDGSRINGDPIIYTGSKPPESSGADGLSAEDGQDKLRAIEAMERVLVASGLTSRQLLILRFKCDGYTQAQIARTLGITRQAVSDAQAKAEQRLSR